MSDRIEQVDGSTIQHGPGSDRVYLMKLGSRDAAGIIRYMESLVEQFGYSKMFAKIPAGSWDTFREAGYILEAEVPGLVRGREAGLFVSRFIDRRQEEPAAPEYEAVLRAARAAVDRPAARRGPEEVCRICQDRDAEEMAALYRLVFQSYPFPIDDPGYLRQVMQSHVLYFGAWQEGRLVALSSAEIDISSASAEMTDFATQPDRRGRGLAGLLLGHLEEAVRSRGIVTAYTIARAVSHGMNITFARQGYTYAGRLVNNTHICGRLESMNVWYRRL